MVSTRSLVTMKTNLMDGYGLFIKPGYEGTMMDYLRDMLKDRDDLVFSHVIGLREDTSCLMLVWSGTERSDPMVRTFFQKTLFLSTREPIRGREAFDEW